MGVNTVPTQNGTIWAQNIGYRIVNSGIDYVTIHFAQPRTITADTALTLLVPDSVGFGRARAFWSECGIYQTSSDPVAIDPPLPRVQRTNITWIRFRGAVSQCRLRYRWSILFWS